MKISYLTDFRKFKEIDMTIVLGYFDGFHIGHRVLFEKALELGKKSNTKVGLITFNESYYDFINKNTPTYLTTLNQKIELAESLGFDSIYIITLTEEFINLSSDEFMDIFIKDMRNVVVGFDYTFGKNREGTSAYLKEKYQNSITIVDKIKNSDGVKIGTEMIKNLLALGEVSYANYLLVRPYEIEGLMTKVNQHFVFYTENFIPRNGKYVLTLIDGNEEITFFGKIRKSTTSNTFTITSNWPNIKNIETEKHKHYKLVIGSETTNYL